MFSAGFRSQKLSVSSRLAINRLKLLEKKKTEQAQKSRREIADYLALGKDERARIRVEHIIREDYLVEAMEIVELYLDLLLARMGLIQSTKALDPGIAEAVASIIWVTPRMSSEVAELKTVSEQLILKYGKEFGHCAKSGECESINEKLTHKLRTEAPPKQLVENYLVAIAKSHNVAYEPDPCILNPPEIDSVLLDLGDEVLSGGKKGGGGGGGGGTRVQLPPEPHNYPPPSQAYPPAAQAYPPASQTYPPPTQTYPASNPAYPPPTQAYSGPPPVNSAVHDSRPPSYNNFASQSRGPPPRPSTSPVGPAKPRNASAPGNPNSPAPPYSENDPMYPPNPQPSSQGPSAPENSMPVLPQVPTNSFPPLDNSVGGNSAGGEDVDFDDLSRRFEELKKKK